MSSLTSTLSALTGSSSRGRPKEAKDEAKSRVKEEEDEEGTASSSPGTEKTLLEFIERHGLDIDAASELKNIFQQEVGRTRHPHPTPAPDTRTRHPQPTPSRGLPSSRASPSRGP